MVSVKVLFLIYLLVNGMVIDYCDAEQKFELDYPQAQVNRTKRQSGKGKFCFLLSRIDTRYKYLSPCQNYSNNIFQT